MSPRGDEAQIVVYETDSSLRALLGDMLQPPYSVRFAASFEEIGRLVATGSVELVIADTWGPSVHTLGTAEFDQIVSLSRSVALIMFTGRAWADRMQPLHLGTTVVIQKPMDLEPFLVQVAAAIKRGLDDPVLIAARELARERLAQPDLQELVLVCASP